MGAERYEVLIVSVKTGRQTRREWSDSELVKGVPWLKRMNAQGGDIYLRPLGGPELLLIDAPDAQSLKHMHRQGLAPAVTIKTSPGRFQAWVKMSDHPLAGGLRKRAVSDLFLALPKVEQHGWLAGFTNHQVKPILASRQPFVLCEQATGKVAPAAQQYFAVVERAIFRAPAPQTQRAADAKNERQWRHRVARPAR